MSVPGSVRPGLFLPGSRGLALGCLAPFGSGRRCGCGPVAAGRVGSGLRVAAGNSLTALRAGMGVVGCSRDDLLVLTGDFVGGLPARLRRYRHSMASESIQWAFFRIEWRNLLTVPGCSARSARVGRLRGGTFLLGGRAGLSGALLPAARACWSNVWLPSGPAFAWHPVCLDPRLPLAPTSSQSKTALSRLLAPMAVQQGDCCEVGG